MKKMLALLCCVLLCAVCVLPVAADETTTTTTESEQTTTTTTTTETETTTTTTTTTTEQTTTTTGNLPDPQVEPVLTYVGLEGGQHVVSLVDPNGTPVVGATIKMTRPNGQPAGEGKTDENGICRLDQYPEEVEANFKSEELRTDSVIYLPAQLGYTTTAPSTTTSTTKPTTTTTTQTGPTTTHPRPSTSGSTTVTTVPSVNTTATAHGTTSQQNGLIAIGVSYDNAVLSGFGLTESGLTSYARMMLTPAYYAQLAATGMPLLSLAQADQVSEQQVLEATAAVDTDKFTNNDMLKGYGASDMRFFTVNVGLYVFTEDGQAVAATNYPQGVGVTVRLPLPAHMKNAAYVAVCAPAAEGLVPPIVVPVSDGMMEFGISTAAAYTIVAYGTASVGADEGSGFPIGTLLALIAGLLAAVAAMVCLYLFVIRGSRFARDPDEGGYTAPKKARPAKQPRQRVRRAPPQEEDSFLSLADLEDPFKPLHVEKNDITEDIDRLKQEKAKRDIKDFDIDL